MGARKAKAGAKAAVQDDSAEEDEDVQGGEEDDRYTPEEDDDEDAQSINSDNLDDDDGFQSESDGGKKRKRKRASATPSKTAPPSAKKARATKTKSAKSTPRKKRKTAQDEDDDAEFDLELGEGQEIVGRVVRAPTTGRVPPGQISQNTLDFLTLLKRPECNDREWFKLNEPVYRLAEAEWKAFIDSVTDVLVGADPQIPHLPPKDVIHRIYRDVRFSNDKTPYKTGFSASFSRSGRKGIFAGFRPGDSLIAAGSWCPAKNELATIRNNLLRSSTRLRRVLTAPAFVGLFGEPAPDPAGGRSSIFGREDELKVAPKGVPKDHKDIDLLKCRSFAVVHQFTDKEVLQPGFKDELGRLVRILRPLVHCLNDLMTIQDADSSDDDDDADDADEGAASAAETGEDNEDGADDGGGGEDDAEGAHSEDED